MQLHRHVAVEKSGYSFRKVANASRPDIYGEIKLRKLLLMSLGQATFLRQVVAKILITPLKSAEMMTYFSERPEERVALVADRRSVLSFRCGFGAKIAHVTTAS